MASVASTYDLISNRALSALAELDVRDTDSLSAQLRARLQSISHVSTTLPTALSVSTIISPRLQERLPHHLGLCDRGLAAMDKQLRRLQHVDPHLEIDRNVLQSYSIFHHAETQILEAYEQVLSSDQAEVQDGMLESSSMNALAASAEEAGQPIFLRVDILRPRDASSTILRIVT